MTKYISSTINHFILSIGLLIMVWLSVDVLLSVYMYLFLK